MREKIKTSRIKLADLKFFDSNYNGVELSDSQSRGILFDSTGNEDYNNLFCLAEAYPIFKRAPVSNVTLGGVSYGTKLYHVSNKIVTGPCWILSSEDFSQIFNKDAVTLEEIEDYVLSSEKFFKDRVEIVQKRIKEGNNSLPLSTIIERDEVGKALMDEFFAERVRGMQKVKED